jgi:uncharacterized membrane protein YphA (DoxX/SURF4 family)
VKAGIYVYGVASLAAGIINLLWHDFATDWQPIQAFSDHVPGREVYAVLTALWLIAGGILILRPRTASIGGAALAIVYLIFAIFWMPRVYWVIHLYGPRPGMLFSVLDGIGQQMILVVAGAIVWVLASRVPRPRVLTAARWAFGLSCIVFGVTHYLSVPQVAALVPKWLPPSPALWAILTGTGFVLAGIAILVQVLDRLAARLLAAQLLIFSALVCLPWIFQDPRGHEAWGGNAYNLAASAAAWIYGAAL